MSDHIVALRLSRKQAAFLQASLSQLALTTRQAMTNPGIDPERRSALTRRAVVLEITDDAVRSAMLETPNTTRKSARGVETLVRARRDEAPDVTHHGSERQQVVPLRGRRETRPEAAAVVSNSFSPSASSVFRPMPDAGAERNQSLPETARRERVVRTRSNAWLSAFIGEGRDVV